MATSINAVVVVDMQADFVASHSIRSRVTEAVAKLGAQPNTQVIVLEFAGHPKTFSGITKHRHVRLTKDQDDGSASIASYLRENNLSIDNAVLMGVNTHACVKATHKGLKRLGIKSKILRKLCACTCRRCERKARCS